MTNEYPDIISFQTLKMEDINQLDNQFINSIDYVYSSLAIHYLEDLKDALLKLKQFLSKTGSRFVISTHHPVKWGSQSTKNKTQKSFQLGYIKQTLNSKTVSYSIEGDYLNTYPITDKLLGSIDVVYYNRSISTLFSVFKECGFTISDIIEPSPLKEVQSLHPDFYEIHSKIPIFLIIKGEVQF
jgi:SAM-dependent methyltransferase